jgi:hypothetical protein
LVRKNEYWVEETAKRIHVTLPQLVPDTNCSENTIFGVPLNADAKLNVLDEYVPPLPVIFGAVIVWDVP